MVMALIEIYMQYMSHINYQSQNVMLKIVDPTGLMCRLKILTFVAYFNYHV